MLLEFFKNINVSGVCMDGTPNFLMFNFNIAPPLLYYAYIPIIIISLFIGIFILIKDKSSIVNRLFFLITISFALWIINVLVQWIAIPNYYIYFSWKIMPIFEIPIYLGSIYLVYIFSYKKDLSLIYKYILLIVYIIFVILSFTKLNIIDYDYLNCEGVPGILLYFMFGVELASILLIAFIGNRYLKNKKEGYLEKRASRILIFGIIIFLSIFWYSEVFGVVTSKFGINLIGPIGMIIFIGLVTYLIVKYKTFKIKLFATQALVWGLIFLIGSQFFFIKVTTNFILNGVTFIGVIIFGRFLVKSVKKEIEQKERLEQLRLKLEESNIKLQTVNEKLKGLDKIKTEFVSLASHQLRSPLTAIKGYASMLADGDYGELSSEGKEAINRIYQSSRNLTIVVEDLLNVTKIEAGGMKYEMTPFNLLEMVKEESKDFSITAEKKGLRLDFEGDNEELCMVNGDKEKIRQIIINFMDNSIKYTKEGSINVSVRNKDGKVVFMVKDTGMGMTEEIKESLFHKFARGEGARMNTTGSGLGLYLAKEIISAHKGRVWVESEGMGKGSSFFMELDQVK
jgi:signal transduction histidine kinase